MTGAYGRYNSAFGESPLSVDPQIIAPPPARTGAESSIRDEDGHYNIDNIEGALDQIGDALAELPDQYVLLADADRVDGEGPVWDEGADEWISAAGGGGGGITIEQVQDDLGNTSLVAGTGLTKTYDDGAGTITLDVDAAASEIVFTPAGAIAATSTQSAIEELDTEKVAVSDLTPLIGGTGIDISGATVSSCVFDHITTTAVLVNNSTTVVDTGLAVAVEASTVYLVEMVVGYSADAAADIKVRFSSLPAGATFVGFNQAPNTASTSSNATSSPRWDGLTESSSATGGGAGAGASPGSNALSVRVTGVLTVSTTAGTWTIQAAQNAAHASDLRIFAGSYIKLTPVG